MNLITACVYRPIPNSDEDIEIEVTVEGNVVPYTPARINCPVEDSYPEDGGYTEDVSAHITLPNGKQEEIPLTSEEIEQFSCQLAKEAIEDKRACYEERDDYFYEES